MKYLVWIICAFNLYQGGYFFLNWINVLHSSKYSVRSTAIFAIIFLAMGIGGFYFGLVKNDYKTALLVGLGVWILALLFLLINMMTSDYK